MAITYYECCRHCGEGGCGAEDRHRFRCNTCQPNPEDGVSNG